MVYNVDKAGVIMKDLYYVLMKNDLGKATYCKKLIKKGSIKVNGQIITDDKYQVKLSDQISYDNQSLSSQPFTYIMLNKPAGYVCANRDSTYPCVMDLIEQRDCYCLGRLDLDTTGLLLMTDDRNLSKRLLLPQNHVTKKYFVTTKEPMQDSLVAEFKAGIIIDQRIKCQSAKLEIIDPHHCYLTISEGKYHQIKKMFHSVDNLVIGLKRVAFANLQLDSDLKEGQYRYLNQDEIIRLLEM